MFWERAFRQTVGILHDNRAQKGPFHYSQADQVKNIIMYKLNFIQRPTFFETGTFYTNILSF